MVMYAMVNIGVYRALRQPLNFRLLMLMDRAENMRSSLAAHTNLGLIAAMVAAPLLFIATAWFAPSAPPRRWVTLTFASAALAWVVAGTILRAGMVPESVHGRAVINPHREILTSLVMDVLLQRRPKIVGSFPEVYLDDFKPATERRRPPLVDLAPAPRNVIVVVLESVAAEYLSLYGSRCDTTPRLVAESRHALVYDRFYAHIGYTYCAVTPLVYSVYPGPPWRFRPKGARPMPQGLASLLGAGGRRTAFFSTGDLRWGGMYYMARGAGFAEVIGPDQIGGPMASSWGTEDGVMIDALIKWIDADPSRPFFSLLWTDQTHDPYTLSASTVPLDFLDETATPKGPLLERYLNSIRQVDGHLGRLFDALRSRNLADDTLVVITGDHGEAFADKHDVLGHGGAMFDECLRVPLMLWNPRLFPEPRREGRAGGHVDLNPTLAHLLDIDPPADWQGASLFSEDHPGRVYLQADRCGYQFGVTDGRYKYMLYVTEGYERLYDLERDPLEHEDLMSSLPEVGTELRARLSAYIHAEELYISGKDPTRSAPELRQQVPGPGSKHAPLAFPAELR